MSGSKRNHAQTIRKTLHAVALSTLLFPALASGFVFSVDNALDVVDATPGDGICATAGNACTLRAAIQEANAWPGSDNIFLPAGTYTLSLSGSDDTSVAGDLDITDTLLLQGAGSASTTIDGGAIARVIHIPGNTTVGISGITVQNGLSAASGGGISNAGILDLNNSVISGNITTSASNGGGGIYNDSVLTLDNVTIDNNNASAGVGGGIYNGGASSTLDISSSTISNNSVLNNGGGLFINAGTVTITDTTISANKNSGAIGIQLGGGIYNHGALNLQRSTISANEAYSGAGIYQSSAAGLLSIANSTISGNISPETYSGSKATSGTGAGLYIRAATTLSNTTITGNRANISGGGFYIDNASPTISNSIVAANQQGYTGYTPAVSLNNCAFAGTGSLDSSGYNLADDSTCGLAAGGDDQAGGITLPALAFNGGPTQTHAIPAASPADGTGQCTTGTDQRGVSRPVPSCDKGAYELTASDPGSWADLELQLTHYPDPVISGNTFTIQLSTNNNGPGATSAFTITDLLAAGLTYVSDDSTSTSTTYDPGTGAWDDTNTLAAQTAKTLELTVTADTPSPADTITNTASVSASASIDANTTNNTISDTINIATSTDLAVTTTAWLNAAAVTTVIADLIFTYQFDVSNNGAKLARDVFLSVALPTDVTLSTPSAGCSVSAGLLSCVIGDLAIGGSASITLQAKPTIASGTLTTTTHLNFMGVDPDETNNTDTLNLTVIPKTVDMAVAITPSATEIVEGNDISFTITLTNYGPHTASGVQSIITLPANTIATMQSATSEKDYQGRDLLVCSGSPVMTCNLDESLITLAANDSVSVTLLLNTIATDDSSDTYFDVSASVSSTLSTDPVAANDSDITDPSILATDAPSTPTPVTDLEVSLSAGPDQIYVTDPITFTATVTNHGNSLGFSVPGEATGVILTFTITGTATIATAQLQPGCTANNKTVTCDLSSPLFFANTSATVRIIASSAVAGTLSATSWVVNNDGAEPDPDNYSNTDTVGVIIDPEPAFRPRAGSGCFIATAAYGSYLDSHVMALRNFRDNVLLTNALGSKIVDWYYKTSPPIAAYISRHDNLRSLTRWALTPLVMGIEYPLPATLLGLALVTGILGLRRNNTRL